MVEARHSVIGALAEAARQHAATDILAAGDIFDTETPSETVWRQAVAAMGAQKDVRWWIIPGNHDSLAAETLWSRFRDAAPPTVRLLDAPTPVELEPQVTLLPSPATSRFPGRDLTEWMAGQSTPEGQLRIGLAHGGVLSFGSEDNTSETISLDRAASAGLDYLALGDWHGFLKVDDRTCYSGSPERDRFKHQGRGVCLAVAVGGPGAVPQVEPVETGKFDWSEVELPLTPEQDVPQILASLLPGEGIDRRDILCRVRAVGWVRMNQRMTLEAELESARPEFGHFDFDDADLMTECAAEDLDEIADGGALRVAAEALHAASLDERASFGERRIASAALGRLHSIIRRVSQ